MKLSALNPLVTPFQDGKEWHAGNWHAVDWTHGGVNYRAVFHYETRMVEFDDAMWGDTWTVKPISVGHGSVSDQQGCNQIVSDFGWYFSRKGGAVWLDRRSVSSGNGR